MPILLPTLGLCGSLDIDEELVAAFKNFHADVFNACGDVDAFKAFAILKGQRVYFIDGCRNRNGSDGRIAEGKMANASDGIPHVFARDVDFSRGSGITGDLIERKVRHEFQTLRAELPAGI